MATIVGSLGQSHGPTWSSPATIYVGRDLRRVDLYDALEELRNAAMGKAVALDGPDEGTCIVEYRSPRMASESITWTNAYPGWLPGHEIITCEIADLSTA